jgi:hypothetical protein
LKGESRKRFVKGRISENIPLRLSEVRDLLILRRHASLELFQGISSRAV